MSDKSFSWAVAQNTASTDDKLVLLLMAKMSTDTGLVFCNVAALARHSGIPAQVVFGCIRSLGESGLIVKSGLAGIGNHENMGYMLCIEAKPSKFHYVYKLFDPVTGEYYIGSRSSDVAPEFDSYRGSGTWPLEVAKTGRLIEKVVVQEFVSLAECRKAEADMLIGIPRSDHLCRNLHGKQKPKKINKPTVYFKYPHFNQVSK